MITIVNLKQELEFSRGLGDIIDVLKTAALIQFRSFQLKESPRQDFLKEISESFSLLTAKNIRHPYLFEREKLPSAIVVVTSDEGFLGELNTLLVNASLDWRKSKDDEIIVLGERGARYFEDMNENFVFFPGISDENNYSEAKKIRDYLIKGYRKRFGDIFIIYPEFLSLTAQRVTAFKILPYEAPAQKKEENKAGLLTEEILIEPSPAGVLEALAELWMGFKLLEIFWSSKQSEYAARIMHLEGSTQELAHLNQRLAFEYFRQVHALSDKTIREISASKVLLGKGRLHSRKAD